MNIGQRHRHTAQVLISVIVTTLIESLSIASCLKKEFSFAAAMFLILTELQSFFGNIVN